MIDIQRKVLLVVNLWIFAGGFFGESPNPRSNQPFLREFNPEAPGTCSWEDDMHIPWKSNHHFL